MAKYMTSMPDLYNKIMVIGENSDNAQNISVEHEGAKYSVRKA